MEEIDREKRSLKLDTIRWFTCLHITLHVFEYPLETTELENYGELFPLNFLPAVSL